MQVFDIFGTGPISDIKPNINMVDYVVNEEKRTVTAILCGTRDGARDLLRKMYNGQAPYAYGDAEVLIALELPNKFVATARCAEGDTFDVEVGKKLAKKKLLTKYDRARTKAWYRYRDIMEKRMDAAMRAIKKYYSDAVRDEDKTTR